MIAWLKNHFHPSMTRALIYKVFSRGILALFAAALAEETPALTPPEGTTLRLTVQQERLDAVLAAACRLSRSEAQRLIGFVPDGNDLYDRLSGLEYLNFMADVYQVSAAQRKAHIEKYLDIFSLEDAINNQIRSYSKGMKQKLVVIGALIHNPPVWILDEPLGGLDPRAAHLLKEEMQRHCEAGNTVFFSTHVLEVAEKLCTRIGVIAHGQLVAQGTLDELRSGEVGASLEELFLELTDDGGEDA